ncbi:MAG: hypothetical protein IMW98_00365 [Firmicutes bacterium]|nr:hypothetical protein [Bacillota bacterium]
MDRGPEPGAARGAAAAEARAGVRRGTRPRVQAPAALPRRLVEVDVFAGRLEITERYGDDAAEALARELEKLGLPARRVFSAPCG